MANEKRLIAYDPIAFGEFTQSLKNTLEVYDPYSDGYEDGVERVEDWLEFNAVLDAVEVVRCKDCDSLCPCGNDNYICSNWGSWTDLEGWCHKGERKNDAR